MSQPDTVVGRLNRRYFALIREAGIADRRAFQEQLHANQVVDNPSCREWSEVDYGAAINAVREIIERDVPTDTAVDLKALWAQLQDGARKRRGYDREPWETVTLPTGTVVAMRYGLTNPPRRRVLIYRTGPTPQNEWDAELVGLVRAFGIQAWEGDHHFTPSGGQQATYTSPPEAA